MSDKIFQLIINNTPAIFGMIGVFIGGGFAFISSFFIKKLEFKNKISEILLKKRIESHEKAYQIADEMSLMISGDTIEEDNELTRYPHILSSQKVFDQWSVNFYLHTSQSRFWLTTDVVKVLNLIQDYQINLSLFLNEFNEKHYPYIGTVVRLDLINLSSQLEKTIKKFLLKTIFNSNMKDVFAWHKYKPEYTEKKLNETEFFKNKDIIKQHINEIETS